jgi:hypothetical protein
MTSRATRFALCTLTCIVASASVVVLHLAEAGAADDCLAAPRKESPTGRHWYYRIDRSTKRHCWYLGEGGAAVSRAAKSTLSRRAALFAKLRRENPPERANDAHAELERGRSQETLRAEDALLVTPADRKRPVESQDAKQDLPDVATGQDSQSPIAARWPSSEGVSSPESERTNASFAVALVTPDAIARIRTDPGPATSPVSIDKADAQTVSKADARALRRVNSLYSLFSAFCGALVVVALAGAATYFMIGTRERAYRSWLSEPFDVTRLTSWRDATASFPARSPDRLTGPRRHVRAGGQVV